MVGDDWHGLWTCRGTISPMILWLTELNWILMLTPVWPGLILYPYGILIVMFVFHPLSGNINCFQTSQQRR